MIISTTLGVSRKVATVYFPDSISQIESEFLRLRAKHNRISVMSRGQNWGYGCQAPNVDGDLLIDLSKCQRIIDYDAYHGTVTVEPGVTYGDLAHFLNEQGGEWIAPVHGGGSACSVLGNILERGYGITPHTDHFGALLSLRAILNDGSIYESSLKALGQAKLAKLFRYGVGPYCDGLFSQSGLGVVTEVTLRLARRPPYAEMFYFNIKSEDDLPALVAAIKKCKRNLGSTLGGINILNRERVLSMLVDLPFDKIVKGEPLRPDEVDQLCTKNQVSPWLVVGMLYGEKEMVKTAKNQIKANFRGISKRSFYFNSSNRKIFDFLQPWLERVGLKASALSLNAVSQAFDLLLGTPNNIALRLAYWRNEDVLLKVSPDLNPQRDGCGLIWYAPLVEMRSDVVVKYVDFVTESAKKFNANALITLTTVDDLCFDSTVPILFNQKCAFDKMNATALFQFLLEEGAKLGFFPYRLNIESQKKFSFQNSFFDLAAVTPDRYK